MSEQQQGKDETLKEVFVHLSQFETQPNLQSLDEDLLSRATWWFDDRTPAEQLWRLVNLGERILQIIQQNPQPLTRLMEKCVLCLPIEEVVSRISTEKIDEGLKSPSAPVQLLCLAYIRKLGDRPSGAAILAANSELVNRLIIVWLSCENTEVSERALEALEANLSRDNPQTITTLRDGGDAGEARGQGLLWRRLFYDSDIYNLFFEWTSIRGDKHDLSTKRGRHALSVSQGRLLDFPWRVAQFDWVHVITSTLPEVESKYFTSKDDCAYHGLCLYVAKHMVSQDDILLEMVKNDSLAQLVKILRAFPWEPKPTAGLVENLTADLPEDVQRSLLNDDEGLDL